MRTLVFAYIVWSGSKITLVPNVGQFMRPELRISSVVCKHALAAVFAYRITVSVIKAIYPYRSRDEGG